MQINQTEIKDLTAVITMTVEPVDYQEAVKKELINIRKKANIPGFRPGMAPKGMLQKMYGKSILAEVINKLIGENLNKYIEEQNLNLLGDPLPNEELTPQMDLDTQDTFVFAFDIAVAPEFDALLNGKNKVPYYTITVTDEMVENQVMSYAQRFGEYVNVEAVEETDLVKGVLTEQKENGIVNENGMLTPAYMTDKEQAALFAGAKVGDIITFNPTKAFASSVEVSSMLGISKEEAEVLTSDFTLEIKAITRHQAAAIDGELFAKVYGENNVADEADFRARIKAEIEENMAEDAKYRFGIDVKAAVMKKMVKVEFPEAFLKRWVKATNEKITDEELEKDFPSMLDELRWHLAKDQLLKHFNIQVEREDVEAYAKQVAKMQFMQYGLMHVEDSYLANYAEQILKDEKQLRGIVERVADEKVFAALKGVAKIEEKEISHEDFGKLFA